MRQQYGGPKLPKELRDQLGDPANRSKKFGTRNAPMNRKDKRKAERVEKKSRQGPQRRVNSEVPTRTQTVRRSAAQHEPDSDEDEEIDWDNVTDEGTPPPPASKEAQKAPKSILKKAAPPVEEPAPLSPQISRAVKERLAQDDAEIAALEKKLGKKGKKKSKNTHGGLDDIFGDLGDFDSEGDPDEKPHKRKREEDDAWLASKRQKALGSSHVESSEEDTDLDGFQSEDSEESLSEEEDEDNSSALEDLDSGDMDQSDFDDEASSAPVKVRENPYVAPAVPATQGTTTKYVPPALRAPPSSDAEVLLRLRRQVQGLLNRLSEANILSILREIEQVYQNNPRGYVNTTLVDLLMGMLSDPSALLDTFLILHAGFIAAVYKVIGSDFGAQIVERLVSEFDHNYQKNKDGSGKHTNNLMSVVAELYTFQVVGSNLVFDYIRFFLDELSEINTELLLRIVKAAGPQLRQDDPTALKDIVVLLQKSVAKAGQNSLPVRTKFMIETINDLKNNRMKTGMASSAMSKEHTTRMKKQLGTLSTRNLKATEPLRIGLKDIKDTEKKGKWWMVGASWRNDTESAANEDKQKEPERRDEFILEDEDDEVDLAQLAREQRMNTDVRRAIFVSIMSASDFKDAQVRLNKLNLKKSQETEIPRVLVHCAGSEKTYNPYYTVLARRICADHKTRKSFQFALWDIFKSLGEKQDGGEDSDENDADEDATQGGSLSKLVNQGKLYGTLLGRKALPITSLKNLNFPYLQPKTKTFVEVVLVTAILEAQKSSKDKQSNRALLEVFVEVDQAPEMITGVQFFLKKTVMKTDIVSKSEKEVVKSGCKAIMDMLVRVLATTTMDEDGGA